MLARVQGGDVGCPDVVNVREFLFRQFSLSSRRRRISSSCVWFYWRAYPSCLLEQCYEYDCGESCFQYAE